MAPVVAPAPALPVFSREELPLFEDDALHEEIPPLADLSGHEEIPMLFDEALGHEEIPLLDEELEEDEEIPTLAGDEFALEEVAPDETAPYVPVIPASGELLPAEAVTSFTRALVTTMNKSTYYEPGHPAHFSVRDELYGALLGLLHEESQIGYVMQRSNPPEILVDGAATGRVSLHEIMPAGVYQMIVPRFIEYFDRHDLVSLAFRRGLTLHEFERFITVWTRPGAHHRDRGTLSDELINEAVSHVSTVSVGELGLDETELPWQVRVCLARLRRDLRTVPLFSTLDVDALREVKRQIFADVVRPLRDVIQLRMLIEFAPRIEKQLASLDDVQDIDIAASVTDAVHDDRLCELTIALLKAIDRSDGDALLRLSGVVAGCAISLLARKSVESFPALRALLARDMVSFDEIPEALQDEIAVERMLTAWSTGELTVIPSETPRDLRLLGRLVSQVFALGRLDDAARMVAPLVEQTFHAGAMRDEAAAVLSACVPDGALDALIERMEAEHDEMAREPYARLLHSLSERGARALVSRIASHPQSARMGPAWQVLDRMGPEVAGPLSEALLRSELSASALRVFLALAPKHASSHVLDALLRHVRHDVASVRVAALVSLSTLWGARSADALVTALSDDAPEVVAMALLSLIERAHRPDLARKGALEVLSHATSSTAPELCLAAIRAACVLGASDPDKDAVIAHLERMLQPERPSGAFGIGRATPKNPEVVAAVSAALQRLNASASRPPPAPSQPPESLFNRIFRGGQ